MANNKYKYPDDPENPNEFFSHRSPETRIIHLNSNHQYLQSLKEIGVLNFGIDFLDNFYRAGLAKAWDHLLYFVIEGSVWIECEDQRAKVGKSKLAVCPIGKRQVIELASKSATALWFHIEDRERWTAIRQGNFRVLDSHESENIEYAMQQILRETSSPQHGSEQTTLQYAQLIAVYLDRELESLDRPAHRQMKYKLFQLWDDVNADLAQAWNVKQLSKKMHVSTGYLHRIMLLHEGIKPMEKVTQLRMQRAANLLKNTYYTLDQIAELVGYATQYSFSNAFLRYYGERPGNYRRRHGRKIETLDK